MVSFKLLLLWIIYFQCCLCAVEHEHIDQIDEPYSQQINEIKHNEREAKCTAFHF